MTYTASRKHRSLVRLLGAIAAIALTVSACATALPVQTDAPTSQPQDEPTATPVPPTATPVPPFNLEGTAWILLTYANADGDLADVLAESLIDVTFADGRITGTAGCNRYFADLQTADGTLTLGPIGATRMACGEALDTQEIAYLAALERAATYTVADGQLHFVDADGVTVLVFREANDAADTGTLPAWTEDLLRNATYVLEDLGEVTLVDGEFVDQYGDGASMVNKAGVVDIVLGDLDGDGTADAAVVLYLQTGGSGTFLHLAAMRNVKGIPQQAGIVSLGDRVQPGELTIADGTIVLEALTHGPDDPMCCPSQKTLQTYALENGALTLVASETVTPALLGVVWTWIRFDDTAELDSIEVDDPSRYTLEFLDDGTYVIRADCNQGSGGATIDGSNLTLGPGPMALAECGPDSLYDDYVRSLGDVVTYVFDGDHLVLNLKADAGNLVFAPAD